MRLEALVSGFARCPVSGVEVRGLSLDSRTLAAGDAFVALAGATRHGLEFLDEAVAAGCVAVLWEPADGARPERLADHPRLPAVAIAQLRVNLGRIASRFFGDPSRAMDVFGVTGTNGKSSYVHLLGEALDRRQPTAVLGTLGAGRVGALTPQSLTTADVITVHRQLAALRSAGARAVAMEVSSHALDQHRVAGVRFRAAAWTNLTRDHLDYHGTMARYAAAKARLLAWEGLEFAILNADDPAVATFRAAIRPGTRCLEYGLAGGEVRAEGVACRPTGTRFDLLTPGGRAPVENGLLGRFNVANQLAVAGTLFALGWSTEDIASVLSASTAPPGRMATIARGGQPLVVIDYAHTPDALAQSLEALAEHGARRVYCVFGCGGERDRGKRPAMGRIAERLAHRVFVTDDNPRGEDGDRIVADILAGIERPDRVHVDRDRARAIAAAIGEAGAGDVVLVAGKGHETYQEVCGRRHAFDDRRAAKAALERVA